MYANGEYKGETPKNLPSKWGYIFFIPWGDTTHVRLEKEGYRMFERTIPNSELSGRWWTGDCVPYQSEFGFGHTFPFTFHLEEAEQRK